MRCMVAGDSSCMTLIVHKQHMLQQELGAPRRLSTQVELGYLQLATGQWIRAVDGMGYPGSSGVAHGFPSP